MKLKALAPWYGSKRTLAPRIIAELGRHGFYVVPFCGSMAVLLAKDPAPMEAVNDLHGDLINLARVLANEDAAKRLYARAERLLMHESLHAECKAVCTGSVCDPAPSIHRVGPEHEDRALAYLVMSWQGRNGSAGTSPTNLTVARRFTSNGGSGGLRWKSAVDSIPEWHERLRSVSILNMDAFELIVRLEDKAGTVIYVDPPYLRKTDKYIHEIPDGGHERLCQLLGRFRRTRVVVSYYDEPELRAMYAGWTWIPVPVTKGIVNQGQRDQGGVQKAPEVLIVNGPEFGSTSLYARPEDLRVREWPEVGR